MKLAVQFPSVLDSRSVKFVMRTPHLIFLHKLYFFVNLPSHQWTGKSYSKMKRNILFIFFKSFKEKSVFHSKKIFWFNSILNKDFKISLKKILRNILWRLENKFLKESSSFLYIEKPRLQSIYKNTKKNMSIKLH